MAAYEQFPTDCSGASRPSTSLICRKLGQNLKNFRQVSIDTFNNMNEIILLCY